VLGRTVPNTAAAADCHHTAHLGQRRNVLARRIHHVLARILVCILACRIYGVIRLCHAKKVHVFYLTKQKIFFQKRRIGFFVDCRS